MGVAVGFSSGWQTFRKRPVMETTATRPVTDPEITRTDSDICLCTRLLAEYANDRDRAGFDEFELVARPFLLRRARYEISRLGQGLDEAEIVQEVLLNLYRYAHTFRPDVPHAFSTWAARIVRNVVLRFLRRRRSLPTVSLEDLGTTDLSDSGSPEPIKFLIEDEETRELNESFRTYLWAYFGAFRGLTDLQQRVLEKVAFEGQTYRETAAELGMRVEAVKMVIYRARRRLAAEMEKAAAG